MEQVDLFLRFGSALVMGFFIGLQREYAKQDDEHLFAGIRTFTLITLAGCAGALAADQLDTGLAFAAIVLVLGGMIAIAYLITARQGEVGMTTEAAAVVALLIGGLCYWNELPLAAALTVATTIMLSLKPEMRGLIQRLTREDIFAVLKFAAITAIVLPVLPNETFGPLDVFNPYQTWLMVILISGISFSGYVLIKLLGSRRGLRVTGLLGGLVSSTAVTLSMTQRSQEQPAQGRSLAVAILISWAMMFVTVLVQTAILNRTLLAVLWPAVAVGGVVTLVTAGMLSWRAGSRDVAGEVALSNPFELRPAITFGLLFAVVLFFTRAAQQWLGDTGVYLSSILAGVSGVDAVTLSMAQLARPGGSLEPTVAARAVLLAVGSNTLVKGAFALISGSPALRRAIWPGVLAILGTIAVVAAVLG